MTTERPPRRRRILGLLAGTVVAVGLAAGAFAVLDVVVAAFVAILLLTALSLAVMASDWDQHSTFEQREHDRARRRQERWERTADARERDRRRWEAHQARQAGRTGEPDADR